MAGKFCFHKIVNKNKWQDIQDQISQTFRISLRTVDLKGQELTSASVWGGVCEELFSDVDFAAKHCRYCRRHFLDIRPKKWRDGYVCPLGFYNFAAPLSIKDEVMAFLVVGPLIIGRRRDFSFYEDIARDQGLDAAALFGMAKKLKTFTFYNISSIVDFIYDISLYIFQYGYQKVRLQSGRIEPSDLLGGLRDFYLERTLSALLKVSLAFTDAERGSVMLIDEQNKELYIKVAKGLDQDIVEKTRLGLEEGLCGLALSQDKALFVDNNTNDESLRRRLVNKKIKNSMLMPIKANRRSIGILNVATYKENSEKFQHHCFKTLSNIVGLVEATLTDSPNPMPV